MNHTHLSPLRNAGRLAALTLTMTLLAAACSGDDGAGGPDLEAESNGEETAAEPGGTLVFGQTFPIENTNPHPQSGNTFNFRESLFDTLVRLDENREPEPWLATSWDVSDDGLSITFTLRDDVTFHSGQPFDAEAAVWNIEYAMDPENGVQAGGQLGGGEAEVVDDHTFELRFDDPKPQVFAALVGIPIIDPDSDIDTAVGGTGPFELGDFTPGNEMRLVRNENYWQEGVPLLDEVVIRVVPDASSLILSLETGDLDMIINPPLNEVERLEQAGVQIVNLPGPGNFNFLVSTVDEPFDDRTVRQAMYHAIDRQHFSEVVAFGLAETACTVWPSTSPVWSQELDSCEFDLERAEELLSEAGLGDGFETTIHVATTAVPEVRQFAQAYQSDLAEIGVNASIQEVESTQWLSLITESEFPGLLGHAYQFGDLDPAMLFTAHPFGTERNASRFESDEYRTLVTEAGRELDQDRRLELYREVTELIKEEAFILPIANRPQLYAFDGAVQGFGVNALNMPDFRDVSVSD